MKNWRIVFPVTALSFLFFIGNAVASPSDIDNDGKDDLVVYNPSTPTFTIRGSTDIANPFNLSFGSVGDVPNTFDSGPAGDSVATFNRSTGVWNFIKLGDTAVNTASFNIPVQPGEFPITGSFSGASVQGVLCDDLALFNTRTAQWRIKDCSNGIESSITFGDVNAFPVPGDFDGDGIDDLVTFNPRNALWKFRPSRNPSFPIELFFGFPGDIPFIRDFNGDGYEDVIIYRPFQAGIAGSLFAVRLSQPTAGTDPLLINFAGGDLIFPWGAPGDLVTFLDVLGDNKLDLTIFRPSLAQFFIRTSQFIDFVGISLPGSNPRLLALPLSRNLYLRGAVPMDFNRDRRSDIPVVWNFNGLLYWLITSLDNKFFFEQFGLPRDIPVHGDVEGDLVMQPGVVRPNAAGLLDWYLRLASGQFLRIQNYGVREDDVLLGDLNCDGKDDAVLSRVAGNLRYWFWRLAPEYTDFGFGVQFGLADDRVFLADMTGDGCDELVVAQLTNGAYIWHTYSPLTGQQLAPLPWGIDKDNPINPIDFDGDNVADPVVIRTANNQKIGFVRASLGAAFGRVLGAGVPCVGNFSGLTVAEFASFDGPGFAGTLIDPAGTVKPLSLTNAPPVGSVVGPYCEVASNSFGCNVTTPFGPGGSLYKPFSDGVPGAAVALLPKSYFNRVVDMQILDVNGTVVGGIARKHCCPNGGRSHYWFNRQTSFLATVDPLTIKFVLNNGTTECRPVPNAFSRID